MDKYQKYPAMEALASTYDASISSSTEVTLNTATSYVLVTALTKPVLFAWGTADASTSNFDFLIPADTFVFLKKPAGITAVNVLEQAASAAVGIVEF